MVLSSFLRARRHALAALCAACAGLPAFGQPSAASQEPAQPPPRLPIEAFASLPHVQQVMLSPDGKRIAALVNEDDRAVLVVQAVEGGDVTRVLDTDNQTQRFNWARWVGNERLVASVRFAGKRTAVGTIETRLLAIGADGRGMVNLVRRPVSIGGEARQRTSQIQDQVIDWLPDDGRHVLQALRDGPEGGSSLYKVDVETGARVMVRPAEAGVVGWTTDAQHRLRALVRDEGMGDVRVEVCDPDGSHWRVLSKGEDGQLDVRPLGFGLDPQELFVIADHDGRDAVWSVRLDAPDMPRTLRLADPNVDLRGELLTSPRGAVLGLQARVSESDGDGAGQRSDVWSPEWRGLMQSIDVALPGADNRLIGVSADEQRYLVLSSGNGRPPVYYVGDRKTGELGIVGEGYPDLAPQQLVGKHWTKIVARDGLPLHAFLTLPFGRRLGDNGAPLPMVLLPHGGPAGSDGDGFDYWTEFLANRGHAVLQVNFRGSDGQGRAFREAGLQRWGLEMQDDLTDAVQWAVAQGVADAKRVCIVGGSYGGYAALMGAVKTPRLYRCAVSFAGVTDLPALVDGLRDYVGGERTAEQMIGAAWTDRERLRATSPALHADRIDVPVLLVHGTADRVVPIEQSRAMDAALRAAGKPHVYVEQEGGDHWLGSNPQRLQFFKLLDTFLAAHLQPAGP